MYIMEKVLPPWVHVLFVGAAWCGAAWMIGYGLIKEARIVRPQFTMRRIIWLLKENMHYVCTIVITSLHNLCATVYYIQVCTWTVITSNAGIVISTEHSKLLHIIGFWFYSIKLKMLTHFISCTNIAQLINYAGLMLYFIEVSEATVIDSFHLA